MNTNRRAFLKNSALSMSMGLSLPAVLHDYSIDVFSTPNVQEGKVIVFQGDSITDAGRDKENQRANNSRSLGNGYVALASAHLLGQQPDEQWTCHNRGISGNKVFQLAERWKEDCLDLSPDVLSILIGVNDFWHMQKHGYKGTVEVYEEDYRTLLDLTLSALPDVKLIIGEPFVVHGGTAIDDSWYPGFDAYREAAQRVADHFDAVWIPYQTIFEDALEEAPVEYWCPDGVHPSLAGNNLMASAWLKALDKMQKMG